MPGIIAEHVQEEQTADNNDDNRNGNLDRRIGAFAADIACFAVNGALIGFACIGEVGEPDRAEQLPIFDVAVGRVDMVDICQLKALAPDVRFCEHTQLGFHSALRCGVAPVQRYGVMLGFRAGKIRRVIRVAAAASKGRDPACHVALRLCGCANLQVGKAGAHQPAHREPVSNCRCLLATADNTRPAAAPGIMRRRVCGKRPKRQVNGAYAALLIALFQLVGGEPAPANPFAEKLHCLVAVNLEGDNAVRGQPCQLLFGQDMRRAAHGADRRRLRCR